MAPHARSCRAHPRNGEVVSAVAVVFVEPFTDTRFPVAMLRDDTSRVRVQRLMLPKRLDDAQRTVIRHALSDIEAAPSMVALPDGCGPQFVLAKPTPLLALVDLQGETSAERAVLGTIADIGGEWGYPDGFEAAWSEIVERAESVKGER